jgi:pantoate--beta-alanine ligase
MVALFDTVDAIRRQVRTWKVSGKRVGLVPTMGALHAGHISLVDAARRSCDVVVTTIFVNPTQFGPTEDFGKYPRTLDADRAMLDTAGCDAVFVPMPEEMYPPGFSTYVAPPACARMLEGEFRPGHFRGVCSVVLKLFLAVPADVAVFGQKDFQQALVIRKMVEDLNLPIEIEVQPTMREFDGLAMSSRNRYLSPIERNVALSLSRALQIAELRRKEPDVTVDQLESAMHAELRDAGVRRIDYATIRSPETLEPATDPRAASVGLMACFVGSTRLIDNRVWPSLRAV